MRSLSAGTTMTTADPLNVRPGAILQAGRDRFLVTAVDGVTLTVRPRPWWRWVASWARSRWLTLKWWALRLYDDAEDAVRARLGGPPRA